MFPSPSDPVRAMLTWRPAKAGRRPGALRRLVLVGALTAALGLAPPAGAQDLLEPQILDLHFEVLGLDVPVETLAGAAVDLRVQETEREVRFRISGDVLFGFDSVEVRPEAEAVLLDLAGQINERFPRGKVRVEGHTDAKGSDAYNLTLSQRRAEAVKRWLAAEGGIAPRRIVTKGLGEIHPVAPNAKPDGSDDPEGRQKNRRVEIVVKKG